MMKKNNLYKPACWQTGCQNSRNDKVNGFTLLELLVVIGIIGIIMALATVAYSATQKSGRDARRRQDVAAVQNSLEQYYAANGYVYPEGDCSLASVHLKGVWPTDPGSATVTPYSGASACTQTAYCICAKLESGLNSGNSINQECDFSTAGNRGYYCVGNLQ